MLLFKAKLLHIKVLFLQAAANKEVFLRLMFLLFHSPAKAILAPWDDPAFAMLRCHSTLLEHESGLWGHWKAGREGVAKNHSGMGPPSAPKPTCVPAPRPGLVCLWCPATGWGALWPGGVPKARIQLPV